ncbi:hypothetical protein [Streptomyces vastus]|uniref:hypothetical protein n=1 Tax=Streptomyces vastus TaxID=285451 RepID=UPI0031D920C0
MKTLPERTQAADAVNMSECWDAVAPDTGGEETLTHFTWCKVGLLTVDDVRCDPGCKTVGSVSFRMSMMGMGNQGSSATEDRKVRIWVMLDQARISTPPPNMSRQLRFVPECSTTNNKKMRVARVKGSNIADSSKWQYLNAEKSAWMYGETEGNDLTNGIANEYSVTPHKGNFILVSQDSTEAFSGKIRMWHGCDPYGPFASWVGHDVVYQMPEPGPYGTCEDGRCFSYNAHAHPSLSSGDRWTLSYNVNNFDTRVSTEGAHFRDPTIYRPRFVSFKLVSTGTLRSQAKLSYSAGGSSNAAASPCRPKEPPIAGTFAMKAGTPCP